MPRQALEAEARAAGITVGFGKMAMQVKSLGFGV